jgi:methionyl aminopeptidase
MLTRPRTKPSATTTRVVSKRNNSTKIVQKNGVKNTAKNLSLSIKPHSVPKPTALPTQTPLITQNTPLLPTTSLYLNTDNSLLSTPTRSLTSSSHNSNGQSNTFLNQIGSFFNAKSEQKNEHKNEHKNEQKSQWLRYNGPRRSADEMYKLYPVSPIRTVPDNIPRPDYTDYQNGTPTIKTTEEISIKTPSEIKTMRRACSIASYIREFAGNLVRPGITLDEIDAITHDEIIRLGVYPSPLGYYNFPKCLAASPNNVVCHAIPDMRVLEDGDIINLDVSIFADGYHGDCSGMFVAGKTDKKAMELIDATWNGLNQAIGICRDNQPFNQIGHVIEQEARKHNFGINPTFCGHGIGKLFHEKPTIYHYENNHGGVMKTGMTFTIEPIFIESPYVEYVKHRDNWAILTVDGARTAQFEQTVLVQPRGAEVLTQHRPGYYDKQ